MDEGNWLLSILLDLGDSAQAVTRVLSFLQQPQQMPIWCWAAVVSSLASYWHRPVTQCGLASTIFNANCCAQPNSPACARLYFLRPAMEVAGMWKEQWFGKPPYPSMSTEIDAARPLAMGLHWIAGGGHTLSIYGYWYEFTTSDYRLLVGDPWWGPSWVSYWAFPEQYMGGASWTETDTCR